MHSNQNQSDPNDPVVDARTVETPNRAQKRVVHMSSVHTPYDTRIFLKECRTLAKAGYDVTYVVAQPAVPERDGVKFVSVPAATRRLSRMVKTAREVYRQALKLDADLYHFHDPELVPWGVMLRLRGKKVVMDVHEEASRDIIDKHWLPKPTRPAVAFAFGVVEKAGAMFFNGIVAAFPALLKAFPKKKTALVNNFPILGELEKPGSVPFADRPRRAAYVGGITEVRGIYELLEGLAAIPKEFEFELHVAGQFAPASVLEEAKLKPGFDRLRVLGSLSRNEVAELLSTSRFGVIFYKQIANHMRSFPTKLFEYASAGLPTLATDIPLWVDVIEKGGLGFCVDIDNPQAVAEKIMYMTDHPEECEKIGENALNAVKTRYNWDVEAKSLMQLYERILS